MTPALRGWTGARRRGEHRIGQAREKDRWADEATGEMSSVEAAGESGSEAPSGTEAEPRADEPARGKAPWTR